MQLAQKYLWLFMSKLMMLKKNYADFIVLAKCASLSNRALKYLACLLFTIKKIATRVFVSLAIFVLKLFLGC